MIPFQDTAPCRCTPWVTWSLIGVNVLLFLILWWQPEETRNLIFYHFGLVPARYLHPEWSLLVGLNPHNYWPFVTNLFLHGGWLHILFNVWLLWIFGDNVEDRMGHFRFLLFFLICGILANIVHVMINRDAMTAAIGASGAIAGVLAAYFYLFPYARVVVWIFPFPLFVPVPAIAFLGLWVIIQAYKATTAMAVQQGFADVAWWGHLGGFAAGFLLFRFFLSRDETSHQA